MDTKEIASHLRLLSELMDLHQENPFKSKSIGNAAFRLKKSGVPLEGKSLDELEKMEGIGKSIAHKIDELQRTGTLEELTALLNITPAGIAQMLSVKGLGPKKVRTIWNGLGIESMVELLYACHENRLIELEGFGAKTQEQIRKAIEFTIANLGNFHYATAEVIAIQIEKDFKEEGLSDNLSLTGDMRRQCELVDKIEFVLASSHPDKIKLPSDYPLAMPDSIRYEENKIHFTSPNKIPIILHLCTNENFARTLFETTGNTTHLAALGYQPSEKKFQDEKEIYDSLHRPFIIPEMREGENELIWAEKNKIEEVIDVKDLKGILHNHSKYSDGLNTLAEMAEECKKMGYEYFGIADHSQTAVYAGGLKPEAVHQQHAEIEELNKKLAPFRVFKGIESDILGDGSLDYSTSILESFDYVVASIHSNLKMTEDKAMLRLMTAIANPYTTILGHPTGRLLLAREGYPIDHKTIIDECAKHRVVIELNAHPYRLDLDWRWIYYAQEQGVMISINPDAHSIHGLRDMYYGVCVARKSGFLKRNCFNAKSKTEMEKYFEEKKNRS